MKAGSYRFRERSVGHEGKSVKKAAMGKKMDRMAKKSYRYVAKVRRR